MSRKTRILLLSGIGLLVVAAVSVWAIHGAVHGEPAFYKQAVKREPALAEKSSDEFLQQAAAAASDVRKPGGWDSIFTADQINGWLAVDMFRNYPGLLPDTFSDPRVAIQPGDVTLACRYDGPEVRAVLTISCDVYLSAPNIIALRIKGAHCGLVPLPLGKVLEAISYTARKLELPLEWRRSGADPVALLSISVLSDHLSAHHRVELDTIELRDGELFVAGRTESSLRGQTAALALPHANGVSQPASQDSKPAVTVADTRRVPVKAADSINESEPIPAALAVPAELSPDEALPVVPLPPQTATPEQRPTAKKELAPKTESTAAKAEENQPLTAGSRQENVQR